MAVGCFHRIGGSWNKNLHLHSCNDATERTREVPLVHASCDVIALSRTFRHNILINFTAKSNAHGTFWNLHIKINLKINILETNWSTKLKFSLLSVCMKIVNKRVICSMYSANHMQCVKKIRNHFLNCACSLPFTKLSKRVLEET